MGVEVELHAETWRLVGIIQERLRKDESDSKLTNSTKRGKSEIYSPRMYERVVTLLTAKYTWPFFQCLTRCKCSLIVK